MEKIVKKLKSYLFVLKSADVKNVWQVAGRPSLPARPISYKFKAVVSFWSIFPTCNPLPDNNFQCLSALRNV